ncbi:MAG: DoxX family membrane protein [Micrococcales bacterium]|nr:DoxX family membrane protein [Micrococcales bacterium]
MSLQAPTKGRWNQAQPWVSLLLRLAIAAVALWAAIPKLVDIAQAQRATAAYQIFPVWASDLIGIAVPVVELAIAICLLAGFLTRYAAAVFGLMMVAFVVGIASAWARGLNIDCGCFGGGGELPADQAAKYGLEIARDVGLAAAATVLMIWPSSPASIDKVLRLDPVTKGA